MTGLLKNLFNDVECNVICFVEKYMNSNLTFECLSTFLFVRSLFVTVRGYVNAKVFGCFCIN